MAGSHMLLRFLLGGAIIALLPVVARHLGATVGGLLLLFPAITLVGLFFLERSLGTQEAVQVAGRALYVLPTVLAFLLTVWFLGPRLGSFTLALLGGVLAWLGVAVVLMGARHLP